MSGENFIIDFMLDGCYSQLAIHMELEDVKQLLDIVQKINRDVGDNYCWIHPFAGFSSLVFSKEGLLATNHSGSKWKISVEKMVNQLINQGY